MKRSSLVEKHNEEELLGERSTMKRNTIMRKIVMRSTYNV
jgi:hypothetical protein